METADTRLDQHAQPYGPLAIFRERGIMPPSGVYIAQDDVIQLRGWAPTATVTVRVTLRILNNAGVITPCQQTISIAANGATVQVNTISADEGFLISASVDGDATQRGLCFVQMIVRRGLGGSDTALGEVFMQGYVSIYQALSYPNGVVQGSLEGAGAMRLVVGTDPVAGAEISETVPAGRMWILRALSATFVADATVANRTPLLFCDDGGANTFAQSGDSAAVTAGQTINYAWANSYVRIISNTTIHVQLASALRLPAGFRIRTTTLNLQAGDNWGAPRLFVEEFISQ
jgi:hypothetical protein